MGAISANKLGGVSLLLGPVLALVFFLLQPGGLLIDRVESSDAVGAITAYASNPALTRITSMVIALGLVMMLYGQAALVLNLRDSGRAYGLAGYGVLFLLIGGAGWVLVQGIHVVLAGVQQSPEAIAAATPIYEVDAGVTLMGRLVVSVGFLLFSLGLTSRGGLYKTTGFVVAIVALVSLLSLIFGVSSPDNLDNATAISRACYFPWVIWSVWLGVGLLKEA